MYILASSSPRRKELLHTLIDDFKIIPPNVDENIEVNDPTELPLKLSTLKATNVFKDNKDDIILASDTIVLIDNKILGKPKDNDEAYQMLKLLSNKEHKVITGYTLISKEKFVCRKITSTVIFNELSDDLINSYIASGSPMDKAGAYGIQDNDNFNLIKSFKGSYSNVMGLPLEDLKNYIY
ncbi:MAG: septum formation protein Maf [Bacilli bacterium]|nr:septum formation protein Maf [Bacilli bacterium]